MLVDHMDVYVIRHGIAHELGEKNEFMDEKRTLTSDGRAKMREAARGMARLGIALDLMLTSPLVRAAETAEIVADALGLKKNDIRPAASLSPGSAPETLFADIKATNAHSIALVGHQPDLGDLVSRIVAGSGGLSIELRKGSLCLVNVTETVPALRGNIRWLIQPKQLRAIGK